MMNEITLPHAGQSLRQVLAKVFAQRSGRRDLLKEYFSGFAVRIYVGFAILLLLLILVASAGVTGLSVTSRSFTSYERSVDNTVTVAVVDRAVVSMLSNVLLYYNGDETALPRIRESQREIMPLLAAAQENESQPENKEVLHDLAQMVDAYFLNVDQLIELKQKRNHIINVVMQPLGKEAETKIARIMRVSMAEEDYKGAALAGLAQEALMQTLLSSTLFLVKSDPELVEEARRHVDNFVAAVEKLAGHIVDPILVDASYEAGQAGPKGRDAFFEVVDAINTANTLINEVMSEQAEQIATVAQEHSLRLRGELGASTAATVKTIDTTRSATLILAAIAAVLGMLLAWRIANHLVQRTQEIEAANANLQSARQRMVDAIESISEGFVLWNADDRMVMCNSQYRDIYDQIQDILVPGVRFEEVARAASLRQHPIPEAEREAWVAERLEQHRDPSKVHEQRMNDGRIVLVSERRTSEGGVVGVRTDITASKSMEAQLVQASKLATLGEMATGVAHEINQPLTIMRLAAEKGHKYLERGGPEHIPTVLEKLKRIMEQVDRARAITDHMRTFGRKAPDQFTPMTLKEVIDGVLALVGEQMTKRGVAVKTEVTELGTVNGNQIQLEQVLINLLNNARDAIEARVEREGKDIKRQIAIHVGVDHAAEQAVMEMQDTGGGIPEKVLNRIFDPFFTTKEVGKGTGLGLSISYGIINSMGGAIRAENVGEGARFTITLPLRGAGSGRKA